MIKQLKHNISNNALFTSSDRILVACSGGADSVALAYLLKESGYQIALAHCNFKLRGEESDQEEESVQALAKHLEVPFFVQTFETKQFAEEQRIGIQEAARKLRYSWFESIAKGNDYSRIATAHHKDDQLETYLFHVMRGSHWSGFSGIPALNGSIVRPLLVFTKAELLAYLSENGHKWKHDKSNDSIDYSRNKIRHQLIPQMQEIRPGFDKNVFRQIELFKEVNHLLDDFLGQINASLMQLTSEGLLISIKELKP
ncbi:MAG: tRNA lysidine(34) synthetase TilS, partial [Flavobacteriales bacterium]